MDALFWSLISFILGAHFGRLTPRPLAVKPLSPPVRWEGAVVFGSDDCPKVHVKLDDGILVVAKGATYAAWLNVSGGERVFGTYDGKTYKLQGIVPKRYMGETTQTPPA